MLKAKLEAYFAAHENELVEAVCRFIRIPSVFGQPLAGKPFGQGPAAALDEALALCRAWGFAGENLEGYVGVVDANEAETALHILAHLDVVPAGPGWTKCEAFSPRREGDLLYGRGAADDKGPAVAALFALRALRDLGIPLRKNVRLIFGTDEECGMRDISWYYARHPHAPATFSPDASFPLYNLEKGHFQPHLTKAFPAATGEGLALLRIQTDNPVNMVPPQASATLQGPLPADFPALLARIECETGCRFVWQQEGTQQLLRAEGHASHASTPDEGCNALTALLALLEPLPLPKDVRSDTLRSLCRLFPHGEHTGASLGIAQADALSGPLTLSFSVLDWTLDGLRARFDVRSPLCATEESTLHVARKTLAAEGIALEGHVSEAHYVPEDSPFVQTLLRVYEDYSGRAGHCLSMGGGTYVHDIPGGVAFGPCMPGFASHLHEPDECIAVSDLLCAAKIFAAVIAQLCA